jgi:flavin reductase (DIM6/NTAB) family NADH-FMN oxidoreductase RutF
VSSSAREPFRDAFEQLVDDLDYPMFVVTAASGDDRDGCLVGFASQCSIHPARYTVFLSEKNRTYRIALRATTLAVHVLAEGQRALAEHFGTLTGDEVDKLASVPWRPGPGGAPLLADCPSYFVGTILDRRPTGDHTAFLLDPVDAVAVQDPGRGLSFQAVRGLHAGHDA